MPEPHAQRTLVKSPPELWAEVSDVAALARHLGEFGEIRITRLEPETTVAWEGDRARGTVALEPAGWGTKVTITAELAAAPAPEPVAELEPVAPAPEREPEDSAPPAAEAPRPRFFARLFARRRAAAPPAPEPEPVAPAPVGPAPEPELEPEPEPTSTAPDLDGDRATAILTAVLDDLGAAHHRPFSRS
jgi:hypothetical protein